MRWISIDRFVSFFIAGVVSVASPRAGLSEERGQSESAPFSADAPALLRSYQTIVEEHIRGILRTERALASTSEARSGSWDAMGPLLTRFAEELPTDATVWYARPDGSYYGTASQGLSEQNLKGRSYFPTLLEGKDVVGALVISASTGHRSLIAAVPVVSQGRVSGAIGVSLRVRLLSELVDAALELPADYYFYALEPDTRIVLHRYADRLFQTPSDVGDEALGQEFRQVLRENGGEFDYTLKGRKIRSIFRRSAALGWYFFLARDTGPTGASLLE